MPGLDTTVAKLTFQRQIKHLIRNEVRCNFQGRDVFKIFVTPIGSIQVSTSCFGS